MRIIPYLIGLDLGTTGLKAVGFQNGELFAQATESMEYLDSDGVRMEFDADGLYDKTASLIRSIAKNAKKSEHCAGVCISSASGNTVLTDAAGKPICPVISWRDKRNAGDVDASVYEVVGWPYSGMFPLGHLRWLAANEPTLLHGANMVCMSSDYVNFRLTGKFAIDHSTATTFYLQNQVKRKWHEAFLGELKLTGTHLPLLRETGSLIGKITSEAAANTGLETGTPAYLGCFDHPSAARGAGVFKQGDLLLSCGTSWVCLYPRKNRRDIIDNKLLCDPFLMDKGIFAGIKALTNIAARVDAILLRLLPGQTKPYEHFGSLAEQAEPGADGLLINPLMDNEDVHTLAASPKNKARAVMEGVAYLLKNMVDELEAKGFAADNITMVGGPTNSKVWTQIVCDVLNKPVRVVNGLYAGAAGAAAIAGVSSGLYGSIEEAATAISGGVVLYKPSRATEFYETGYISFNKQFQEVSL